MSSPIRRARRCGPLAALPGLVVAATIVLVAPGLIGGTAQAQTVPDACFAPIAYIERNPADLASTYQAFYRASCTAPPVQLTTDPSQSSLSVALLPDGQNALAVLTPADTVVEINLATRAQAIVDNAPGNKLGLSVSPSGDAFSYYRDPVGTTRAGVYAKKLDGSPPVRISPDDVPTYGAALEWTSWSHDGRDIAYSVGVIDGTHRIVYAPVDGSQQQVTVVSRNDTMQYRDVQWAPDDGGLFFTAEGSPSLNYVDLATHTTSAVAADPWGTVSDFAVDQHWDAFVTVGDSGSTRRVDQIWLGDTSTSTTAVDVTGDDWGPSVVTAGPADPAPPGFGSGSGSPTPTPTITSPSATPTPPTQACAAVKFIGVRGSGEQETAYGGLGYTIQTVANTFASQVPLAEISHINYQAIAVGYGAADYGTEYVSSVDTGTTLLLARIKNFIRDCPGKFVVLAGYSQGAHVVGDAFQVLPPAERKQIAAAVLLGDPRFNKKQSHGVNVGDFNSLNGVFSIVQKPRNITGTDVDRVRSFCTGGDPVCNSSPPNIASCASNILIPDGLCPHLLYVERGWADAAGVWAASRFQAMSRG